MSTAVATQAAELHRRRDELRSKLTQLSIAGADAGERLKDGVEEAASALERAFDEAEAEVRSA